MRRAAKTDANQGQIVQALQAVGCSVQSLAAIGKGCPDLLVGKGQWMALIEVKDGSKPPSARRVNDMQRAWHFAWKGPPVHVVKSVEEALALVSPTARP